VEKQLVAQRRNYVILEKQLTADTKIYEEPFGTFVGPTARVGREEFALLL